MNACTVHITNACIVHIINVYTVHITNVYTVHIKNACTVHITNVYTVHIKNACTVHISNAYTVHITNACTVHITKRGECARGNWVHGRGCGEWSCLLNNAHSSLLHASARTGIHIRHTHKSTSTLYLFSTIGHLR